MDKALGGSGASTEGPGRRTSRSEVVAGGMEVGVTYRAVFAGGTWKGLASPSGDVPVDLVLAAAQDAAAAAPRDRDRLLALVSY